MLPASIGAFARLPLRVFTFLAAISALLLSGCATAPATFKTHPTAAGKFSAAPRIVVVPIDAELAELTAGGVLEPHEDWTSAAQRNLTTALTEATGYPAESLADASVEVVTELEDVQALLRTFTLHRQSVMIRGGADPFSENNQALNYETGGLPQLAAATKADILLFVFIRDSFASSGRKSLVALSVVGAALTGVAIVPAMGSTTMSAALVDRDGTVLWFNHSLGGHDPRTAEGARALVKAILQGRPGASPTT